MPRVKYVGPYHYRVLTRRELAGDADLPEGVEDEPLVWGRQESTIIDLSDSEFERLKQIIQSGEFVTIDDSSHDEEQPEGDLGSVEEEENAPGE